MINNLPTTSGQHWFKEEGKEDWQPYYVTSLDGEGLICHCSEYNVTSRCLVSEMPAGQRAKAHKPDEGIEAWVVFNNKGIICTCPDSLNATEYSQSVFNRMCLNRPYTCEPVTIYRNQK